MPSTRQNEDQRELVIVGGSINWYIHFWGQIINIKQSWKYEYAIIKWFHSEAGTLEKLLHRCSSKKKQEYMQFSW